MKRFLIAVQFLTRINIVKRIEMNDEDFGRSSLYFPLVGLFIGTFLALLAYGGNILFQPLTTAVLMVTGEILLTGGLHLDGYMDSCDGIFSGRSREKMLEIMKDSRVGSMGIIGLSILLLLKTAFLLELPFYTHIPLIVVMPLLGRWAMVFAIYRFPYARSEGLGGYFRGRTGKAGFCLVSLYSTLFFGAIVPLKMYAALPLTAAGVIFSGTRINAALQGHTGDTYGMMNEITEVLFLLCCVILSKTLT